MMSVEDFKATNLFIILEKYMYWSHEMSLSFGTNIPGKKPYIV